MQRIVDLLNQYGPTVLVLIISFCRDQILAQKHQRMVEELDKKMLQNKADVDAKFADMSSNDIIKRESEP